MEDTRKERGRIEEGLRLGRNMGETRWYGGGLKKRKRRDRGGV